MRGASALDQLLEQFPEAPIRVQVVWEPVLTTDFAAPLSGVLGRIDDPRVVQYWDPGLVVSTDLVRSVNEDPSRFGLEEALPAGFVAWDAVAVFPRGEPWERDVPTPVYYGGPVVDVVEATRAAIVDVLADEPAIAAAR